VIRPFRDRRDAGAQLGRAVAERGDLRGSLVLGLARGGVEVAFEVAAALGAPLDVLVVRKLGLPSQPELAMGAIGPGGIRVLESSVIEAAQVPAAVIETAARLEREVLEQRERSLRGDRPPLQLRDRDLLVVDDGLATGATLRAALAALRAARPARITAAVPVGAVESCARIELEVDALICLLRSGSFHAIGEFYLEFAQTPDAVVRELLARAKQP
jgi:putative phosphoribosyl transferase